MRGFARMDQIQGNIYKNLTEDSMSQNNSNEKTSSSLDMIGTINQVPDFDPRLLAVSYTDLKTGEVRARLPVVAQIAWFRLKYPEGKIAIKVSTGTNCFVATARVYPNYKDAEENFLAEATASRGKCEEKPSVSAREWAQTAAIGVALRNAGFGLQFQFLRECSGRICFRRDRRNRYDESVAVGITGGATKKGAYSGGKISEGSRDRMYGK